MNHTIRRNFEFTTVNCVNCSVGILVREKRSPVPPDRVDVGLYHDFEVPLEQLEYQIIGVVSDLYPETLLNDEGA